MLVHEGHSTSNLKQHPLLNQSLQDESVILQGYLTQNSATESPCVRKPVGMSYEGQSQYDSCEAAAAAMRMVQGRSASGLRGTMSSYACLLQSLSDNGIGLGGCPMQNAANEFPSLASLGACATSSEGLEVEPYSECSHEDG